MDATAKRFGVKNPDDFNDSSAGAAKYLGFLFKRYGGDVDKTLAGYNAGEGNVDKYHGVPPFAETQDYVRKIKGYMRGGTDPLMSAQGVTPSQRASITNSRTSNSTSSTTDIKIGTVTIQTNATDAKGIMRDMHGGILSHSLVNQTDSGIN